MNKPSLSPITKALLAGVALMAVISAPLAGSATELANSPFHLRATNIENPGTYAIKPGIKKTAESEPGSGTGGGSTAQPGTGTGGSTTPPATTAPTTSPTSSTPADPTADLISINLDTRLCNTNSLSITVASYSSLEPTVKLPLDGTISWGDGTSQKLTYGSISHTYKSYGQYTMDLRGTIGGLTASNASSCYTAVTNMGDETGIKTLEGFLNGAKYLTTMVEPPVTLENGARMLQSATGFNGDTSQWTLPNLKDATLMFGGASTYNGDLGKLDTRKLIKAGSMFYTAYAFEGKGLENWKTPSLTNASQMFGSTRVFNGNIGGWDVSKVQYFNGMFNDARAFDQPLDRWNPESAITVNSMFKEAPIFNGSVDGWNLSKVTDFSYMFSNALKFNQPINGWNVSGGTTFENMFYRNGSGITMAFNQPLDKWNTGSATTMTGMFRSAGNFAQDLSMWDVSNVTRKDAFAASTKMTTAQLPKWK